MKSSPVPKKIWGRQAKCEMGRWPRGEVFDRSFNGDSTRERPESDAQLNLRNSEGDFESKMVGERGALSLI